MATASAAAATTTTPTAAAPDATCRYAGKKCANERAVKRNGALHNLCHYHRVRANQNQRRMELRRRIKRSREDREAMAMGMVTACGGSFGAESFRCSRDAAAAASLLLPSSAFLDTRTPVSTGVAAGFSALLLDTTRTLPLLPSPSQCHPQSQSALAATAAASWSYYAAAADPVLPTHDALLQLSLPALSSHDHLSALFSAAAPPPLPVERSQSSVGELLLPHVSSRFHKQLLDDDGDDGGDSGDCEAAAAQLRFQYAAALSSPVSPGHSALLASAASSMSSMSSMAFGGRSSLDPLAFPEHPHVVWCDQELLL